MNNSFPKKAKDWLLYEEVYWDDDESTGEAITVVIYRSIWEKIYRFFH